MNKRLETLRYSLGLEWGELAERLKISRAMIGFIRNGKRKPSAALLLRISELEQQAGGNSVAVANDATNWRERALLAERKLLQVREAIDLILKATAKLNEAVK
jgi:transcriptional regulator with XRE-family HTH domain